MELNYYMSTRNDEVSMEMINTIDTTNRKILEIIESLIDRITKLEKIVGMKK